MNITSKVQSIHKTQIQSVGKANTINVISSFISRLLYAFLRLIDLKRFNHNHSFKATCKTFHYLVS